MADPIGRLQSAVTTLLLMTSFEQTVLAKLSAHREACRHRRIEREVTGLLLLLDGIRDPEIQVRRFAEALQGRAVEEAAWTLACVAERLASRDEKAQNLGFGLLDRTVLAGLLGEAWMEAVRTFLEARGDPAASLFRAERLGAREEETPPKEPLGFRVSLARQPVRRLIERLLFDPDARVVRVLLGNPRLTEADAVKLAASRRASPPALEAIAQDARWVARYPVKLALASNPVTPVRIVVGLLPHLLQRDLRDLSQTGPRSEVRGRAAALLAAREDG